MKYIFFTLGALFLFSSCQNTQEQKTTQEQASATATHQGQLSDTAQCFQFIQDKDTTQLSFNIQDHKVTGTLMYNLYEKDKNQGSIEGLIKGDTLIADYNFTSEGVSSIRQVVFLKQGDQWIEGYGEVEDKGGAVKFKDLSTLTFDNSRSLHKVNCNKD